MSDRLISPPDHTSSSPQTPVSESAVAPQPPLGRMAGAGCAALIVIVVALALIARINGGSRQRGDPTDSPLTAGQVTPSAAAPPKPTTYRGLSLSRATAVAAFERMGLMAGRLSTIDGIENLSMRPPGKYNLTAMLVGPAENLASAGVMTCRRDPVIGADPAEFRKLVKLLLESTLPRWEDGMAWYDRKLEALSAGGKLETQHDGRSIELEVQNGYTEAQWVSLIVRGQRE